MDTSELQIKTMPELQNILQELKKKLQDLRISVSQGKVKDVNGYRKARKDIARVSGAIKKKESGRE